MIRPGLLVMLALSVGCARGSADSLDASIGSIGGSDGGLAGDAQSASDEDDGADQDGVDEGDGPDDQGDGTDSDGTDSDGTDSDGTDSVDSDGTDTDGADSDGTDADGTDVDDAADDMTDDGPLPVDDAGLPPQPIVGDFRVRQDNAALNQPLVTGLQLNVGDRVTITGSGKIWPGLVLQGCCGPTGTSGAHSGAEWPLQGGPDFALVAFVNGAWTFVGNSRSFDVTVAGALSLGTNDNDPGTGDDCTSEPESNRGFSAHVVITPAH